MQKHFCILLGWSFVLTGMAGIVLPLLPTTPFLILALACFARSSLKFHQMLLNNRWVGPILKHWEESRAVSRTTKRKASVLIILTFLLSILILHQRPELQISLILIAGVLLFFIWRLPEE
ncbi:MAG TPA: DUF454 domain-containing protein [Chromatiales bacterium]|nr:DUF454 domain-containing protein [Thiotrichales bacterium]HIP67785.1 DUF454 domain-containing protein [Chromatiales bacterium]